MATVETDEISFVLMDGRLGVGYCKDKEAGGITIIKWCPDYMVVDFARDLLERVAHRRG